MNPIFSWLIGETVARTMLELLTRHCPSCGREQVVPKELLRVEVKCLKCGARVPPKAVTKR